jgi:hypothetical protein
MKTNKHIMRELPHFETFVLGMNYGNYRSLLVYECFQASSCDVTDEQEIGSRRNTGERLPIHSFFF